MTNLDQIAADLAAHLTPAPPEDSAPRIVRRWGTVTAIGTQGVTVALSGSTTTLVPNVARLARYRPLVGQRVLVDFNGSDPLIVDCIANFGVVEAPHAVGGAGEPAFTNGWSNYGGTPAYASACFWKDPEGFVWLCGVVKSGTGSVFTLPVGYRPALSHDFGTLANAAWNEMGVHADGTIVPTGAALPWLSLSGISFPTDVSRFHWVGAAGEPAFLNGWVNYGGTYQIVVDGVARSAGFYLDANGFVHLTGLIKSGTMGTAAFVLPAGFRPPLLWMAKGLATGAVGRVDIDPLTGAVTPQLGTNGYQSLEGIVFPTDMTAWHPMRPWSFAAGQWDTYELDSSWSPAGFFVDPYEIAHYTGLLGNGPNGQYMGVPGPGMHTRSGAWEIFATVSNGAAGRVDTYKSGAPVAQSPTSSAWCSMWPIMFRVRRPGG